MDAHIHAAHLESDGLRKLLAEQQRTPYRERDWFQRVFLYTGRLLISHGVPVIFDAPANRGKYREAARASIPRFLEIHAQNRTSSPGARHADERDSHADLVIDTSNTSADAAADLIASELRRRHWV